MGINIEGHFFGEDNIIPRGKRGSGFETLFGKITDDGELECNAFTRPLPSILSERGGDGLESAGNESRDETLTSSGALKVSNKPFYRNVLPGTLLRKLIKEKRASNE